MKDNIVPIQDEIVLYQSEDGNVKVDVLFQDETGAYSKYLSRRGVTRK